MRRIIVDEGWLTEKLRAATGHEVVIRMRHSQFYHPVDDLGGSESESSEQEFQVVLHQVLTYGVLVTPGAKVPTYPRYEGSPAVECSRSTPPGTAFLPFHCEITDYDRNYDREGDRTPLHQQRYQGESFSMCFIRDGYEVVYRRP